MTLPNFFCQGCMKPINSDEYITNKDYLAIWVSIKKVLCNQCLQKLYFWVNDYANHVQTTLDSFEKEATKN